MIEFKNVSFYYKRKAPVFNDYSLKINRGERLALTGASGCGKTTLLRLICGLEVPKSGEIIKPENLKASVVFQENRLIPHKTVLQNVALFSDEERARSCLKKLEIEGFADSLPRELSGGQKRRVAIARALCREFDILLLDEPFTGLDSELKDRVIKVVDETLADKTLVMVTHDLEDVKALKAKTI